MRIITILFIMSISLLMGYSQTEKKAEKLALKCIDKALASADKDINYLLRSPSEYNDLISLMDTEKLDKKRKEVDSILTVSGFYKSAHLDISLLKNCMLNSYDLNNVKNDTTSSYYQLLNHLIYLSENPSIFKELSPSLHLEAIKSIITTDKQDNDFYKVISFILFQGIVKEFENYANSRKSSEKIPEIDSEPDKKHDSQILMIVDDDVEIEEELTFEEPIDFESSCGEEIAPIVEKMPEYNGGKEAITKYLHVDSTEYQGKILVQFIVDCNGNVKNPKIVKGLTPPADKIAIDLFKSMPKWSPAEQRGEKVNVQLIYPVIFD